MDVRKTWQITPTLILLLIVFLSLPACNGTETTPTATPSPVVAPSPATPPVLTIKQELEDQLDMLRALVVAEKGRGRDVSQAEQWLSEADQALQFDDLLLARQKLREAGNFLGVKLP